jgi:hypothetical protein
MAVICLAHGIDNVLPALVHVVFGADRYGFDEFLRSDDMLDCMTKLLSQLAMSDKHKSDHENCPLLWKLAALSHRNKAVQRWEAIFSM